MAGYYGFSMSNNAVDAYESGEKPLSKWTKTDIIAAIEDAISEEELTLLCCIEKLKKAPVTVLKDLCLEYSSWHHTSKYYNKTDFYSLNIDRLERLTDEDITKEIAEYRQKKKTEPTAEKWKCAFLEWGGTRKHPTATEIVEEGLVKGNWFYLSNGTKKKTTANGFRFIERIEEY